MRKHVATQTAEGPGKYMRTPLQKLQQVQIPTGHLLLLPPLHAALFDRSNGHNTAAVAQLLPDSLGKMKQITCKCSVSGSAQGALWELSAAGEYPEPSKLITVTRGTLELYAAASVELLTINKIRPGQPPVIEQSILRVGDKISCNKGESLRLQCNGPAVLAAVLTDAAIEITDMPLKAAPRTPPSHLGQLFYPAARRSHEVSSKGYARLRF